MTAHALHFLYLHHSGKSNLKILKKYLSSDSFRQIHVDHMFYELHLFTNMATTPKYYAL
jgi:hypothetical protein